MKVAELVKRIYAWEPIGTRRVLCRCDVCGERNLVQRYHEVYYERTPTSESGWLWCCTRCLLAVVGDIAERAMWEHEPTPADTRRPMKHTMGDRDSPETIARTAYLEPEDVAGDYEPDTPTGDYHFKYQPVKPDPRLQSGKLWRGDMRPTKPVVPGYIERSGGRDKIEHGETSGGGRPVGRATTRRRVR